LDCAKTIPNDYIVLPACRAVDENLKMSASADTSNIKDWVDVFYPSKETVSVFTQNICCSECGTEIKGDVWFNPTDERWIGKNKRS